MSDEGNVAAIETVLATTHGINLVRTTIDNPALNGLVPQRMWSVRNSVGNVSIHNGNAVLG